MPKKLNPTFTFTFPAPIWKTITDAEATRLFVELRSPEQRSVGFAAVDLTLNTLLWQGATKAPSSAIDFGLTDSWWATLHSANKQFLLLQSFTDTHNPEKKSYYVVDIASQQIVWQSEQLEVVELADNSVVGYTTGGEPRRLIRLTLPEGSEAEDLVKYKKPEAENKSVIQPFFYAENQAYFATVASFVKSLQLGHPVGGCEYLEYSNYVVITYYVPQKSEDSGGLANYLLILDQHGTVLLNECLERSVPQPGLGTFFVAQHQLIVVQNQLQLVSYALS